MVLPYDQKGNLVTSTTSLQENFRRVQATISTLCTNTGRQPPRLIVACKGRDAEAIATLQAQGQREFGENFTTELEQKTKQLQHLAINWVYIGVLQSNKIARLVRLCDEIQSLALAQACPLRRTLRHPVWQAALSCLSGRQHRQRAAETRIQRGRGCRRGAGDSQPVPAAAGRRPDGCATEHLLCARAATAAPRLPRTASSCILLRAW